MLFDEVLAIAAKAFAQGLVGCQLQQMLRYPRDVVHRNNKAGLAMSADFVRAIEVVGDDRLAGGEGLREGPRDGFPRRKVNQAVHDPEIGRNVRRSHQAGKHNFIGYAERPGFGFDLGAQRTIAYEQEALVLALGQQRFGDEQQIVMPFKRRDPSHLPDHKGVRRNAQSLAQAAIVLSFQKRLERKAAENAGVHFGPPNASGEIAARHGIGRTEEVRGKASSESLGAAKKEIRERTLKRTEGRAMDMMDDNRHFGAMGGNAAEDAGFSAVGVDDIGSALAQKRRQSRGGSPVGPGTNRPNEGRHNCQNIGMGGEARLHGTFGSEARARNQFHFEVRLALQTKNGSDSVFLRATDNQPCNDVCDPHWAGVKGSLVLTPSDAH